MTNKQLKKLINGTSLKEFIIKSILFGGNRTLV